MLKFNTIFCIHCRQLKHTLPKSHSSRISQLTALRCVRKGFRDLLATRAEYTSPLPPHFLECNARERNSTKVKNQSFSRQNVTFFESIRKCCSARKCDEKSLFGINGHLCGELQKLCNLLIDLKVYRSLNSPNHLSHKPMEITSMPLLLSGVPGFFRITQSHSLSLYRFQPLWNIRNTYRIYGKCVCAGPTGRNEFSRSGVRPCL